ncbi:MAG: hypothetical protein LQ348_006083 [Seirophora lacunosa]|nr:MAG: hypothetical protein LQ348_006083 [Seirophora lacunosa]
MTRKKKPLPPYKRIQVTDSDGWTHISRSHAKTTSNKHVCSSPKKLLPSLVPTGQTLLDLRNTHSHYRSQWLTSHCHRALEDLLRNDLPPSLPIDRCLVLGLGSLSNGRRSSWWELVFLETLLQNLFPPSPHQRETPEQGKPQGPALYAQDPVFNDLDNAFLEHLGYTVVSDPRAFDLITASTMLFAPHLEVEVYARSLGKAKPRLCVGTAMEECLDRVNFSPNNNHEREMENEIFHAYRDATVSRRLPEFNRDPWTLFTCLYWTKPVDE